MSKRKLTLELTFVDAIALTEDVARALEDVADCILEGESEGWVNLAGSFAGPFKIEVVEQPAPASA